MHPLLDLLAKGGPVMFAILGLSVFLYTRCFQLLFALRDRRRSASPDPGQPAQWRREAQSLREFFRHERIELGALIAAAPLLGLLGTVSGMARTFESISGDAGGKSMEGLAGGISEVLVATESGLAVALPALLFIHLAHRQVRRHLQHLNELECAAAAEPAP